MSYKSPISLNNKALLFFWGEGNGRRGGEHVDCHTYVFILFIFIDVVYHMRITLRGCKYNLVFHGFPTLLDAACLLSMVENKHPPFTGCNMFCLFTYI